MSIRTIHFEVTDYGINPSNRQNAGVQGDHRATELDFTIKEDLYTKITQQAAEIGGQLVYRFDGYDVSGGVLRSDVMPLTSPNVSYLLEEWITRYGGEVQVVLVISINKNEITQTELLSFPALLNLKLLPMGTEICGGDYTSVSSLSQNAKKAAEYALNLSDEAKNSAVSAESFANNAERSANSAKSYATAAANSAEIAQQASKRLEIVQKTGDSQTKVMSQKATSEEFNRISNDIIFNEKISDTIAITGEKHIPTETFTRVYIGAGGAEKPSYSAIATDFISTENISRITIDNGYGYRIHFYDGQKNFIKSTEFIKNSSYPLNTTYPYCRICLSKTVSGDTTIEVGRYKLIVYGKSKLHELVNAVVTEGSKWEE